VLYILVFKTYGFKNKTLQIPKLEFATLALWSSLLWFTLGSKTAWEKEGLLGPSAYASGSIFRVLFWNPNLKRLLFHCHRICPVFLRW